jgi:5-methylcytosine-specific restriction endonuclease McrA
MARIELHIAEHPLPGLPYNQIEFVGRDQNRVPIYRVNGCAAPAAGARLALSRAFAIHGGKCFYCPTRFRPHLLSELDAHRDHVLPTSKGGSDLLHNLVIACRKCGRDKADDLIHDFKPKAAKAYLEALESHIARCVRLGE